MRNNRRQTPLILAAGQGHTHVIELMVTKGAEVSAEDEDGDTSLHLALVRQEVYAERDDSPIIQQVVFLYSIMSSSSKLCPILGSLQSCKIKVHESVMTRGVSLER